MFVTASVSWIMHARKLRENNSQRSVSVWPDLVTKVLMPLSVAAVVGPVLVLLIKGVTIARSQLQGLKKLLAQRSM